MQKMLEKSNECFQVALLAFKYEFYNATASKLYYSCFQLAILALDKYKKSDYPIENSRNHSHKSIIAGFEKYLVREGYVTPELRGCLKRLEHKRMTADYEPCATVSKEEAEKILQEATHFRKIVLNSINRTY